MNLTPGFTVVEHDSTHTGYYRITFRNDAGDYVVVTQHGRGGSNFYTYLSSDVKAKFDIWLGSNDQLAIDTMDNMGYHDLAVTVAERGTEWQDIVVMSILNLVEL